MRPVWNHLPSLRMRTSRVSPPWECSVGAYSYLRSRELKPYHGISWLENRRRFPFVRHEIANLPGVHRARAADLDGDGDQDVVACAYVELSAEGTSMRALAAYPSLVWLEQNAPGTFVRHTLERGGRHVSLDVGDVEGDGDVLVGNFRSVTKTWVELWVNERVKR